MEVQCGFEHVNDGAELLAVYGPTLFVDVGFDPAFEPTSTQPPAPGVCGVQGLVDTGASQSCIDSALAERLGLPIIDRQQVSGAHGKKEVNMHMAQIRVPSLNFTIYGSFAAVNLIAGNQEHQVLIGRTFLRHFHMAYDGPSGRATISHPVV